MFPIRGNKENDMFMEIKELIGELKTFNEETNKMVRYSDIEHLPADHPMVKEFEAEAEKEALSFESMVPNPEDEQSFEYFNQYIAGDR